MNILDRFVSEVQIDSAWLPPVVLQRPFADSPPSPVASALMNFLKPAVTVTLAGGGQLRRAPYGEPGVSNWPTVRLGLSLLAIAAGSVLLLRVLKK